MKTQTCYTVALVVTLVLSLISIPKKSVSAEITASETAIHQTLRQIKDDMLEAANRADLNALTGHIHPNIVLTVENGQRYRGIQSVREFYDRIIGNETKVLKEFTVERFEVDELSILYGDDTAIAFGSAVSKYVPISGPSLTLSSKWSTTLVREKGKWLVAAFHNTVDFTDNPLLTAMLWKISLMWGIGGVLFGGVIGYLIGRKKRKTH